MTDSQIISETSAAAARKQKRGVQTRRELIESARVIFARDGFEHARLEDIAADAGKTRGAFYDHFKDKEDVFCAIFEDSIDQEMAALGPSLLLLPTWSERIEALSKYLCKLGKDRQRTLLNLEFKLYAIRHPRKRKRLADLHAVMRLRCSIPAISDLLSGKAKRSPTFQNEDSLAIGAVVDGLALNHLFDPDALDDSQFLRYLSLCLREAIPQR